MRYPDSFPISRERSQNAGNSVRGAGQLQREVARRAADVNAVVSRDDDVRTVGGHGVIDARIGCS